MDAGTLVVVVEGFLTLNMLPCFSSALEDSFEYHSMYAKGPLGQCAGAGRGPR